jgi:repressor LexA
MEEGLMSRRPAAPGAGIKAGRGLWRNGRRRGDGAHQTTARDPGLHRRLRAIPGLLSELRESRSIELVEAELKISAIELPLLGAVAAGVPIEAIEDQETISVPEDMVAGSVAGHYVLRVRGESMIDEQIRDGDFVIVQSRETAHNGEMVIALIDGENATMKKFYRENGQVRLQPANPGLDPMYFDPGQVAIQGIVIGVIRKY